jgi:hypothetical protein
VPIDTVRQKDLPPDGNSIDGIKTSRMQLGKSGYSILVPEKFLVFADNDSAFRIVTPYTHVATTENQLTIQFSKRAAAVSQLPETEEDVLNFTDTICGAPVKFRQFKIIPSASIPAPTAATTITSGRKSIRFTAS